MTKQQEVSADISRLTLETLIESDGGDSKGNKDMQSIKALQAELDALHTKRETKITLVQETKDALLCLEQEINAKKIDKDQVFERIAAIKVDIEDREKGTAPND